MPIDEIKTIEGIQLKRKEVLTEYKEYIDKNPTSYSYPYWQMKALYERENYIISVLL